MINISVFMVHNLYNDWCIVDCFRMDDGHYLQSAFVSFLKLMFLNYRLHIMHVTCNAAVYIISIADIELIVKK